MSSRPRIIALGDSLTSGHGIGASRAFPAALQQRLEERGYHYEVLNAGVSGDTTAGALRRLPSLFRPDVSILIVTLGANDGLRGVPIAEVKANLTAIIEAAKKRKIAVLLCAMEALPIYGWSYTQAFHRLYIDLAARYNVALVPFVLMNVIGHFDQLLPDRMHPNESGARRIAENVWPYLEPLLRRQAKAAS